MRYSGASHESNVAGFETTRNSVSLCGLLAASTEANRIWGTDLQLRPSRFLKFRAARPSSNYPRFRRVTDSHWLRGRWTFLSGHQCLYVDDAIAVHDRARDFGFDSLSGDVVTLRSGSNEGACASLTCEGRTVTSLRSSNSFNG
jgi:hypothetical protein